MEERKMINVYLNYPNSTATIHQTSDCPRIHAHHSPNQRLLKLNIETFEHIIRDFIEGNFTFRAEAELNDAWLEIDFGDLAFEIAIVHYIIFLLGRQYAPFDKLNPELHC
jgi:hypothetical protein